MEKMVQNVIAVFRKCKVWQYLLCCMFFMLGIFMLLDAKIQDEILPYATFKENHDEEQFVRNIADNMEITQEFISPEDFECLTLSCSNHEMQLAGYMVVKIRESDSMKLVLEERRDFSSIQYGKPVEFHFEEPCKENQAYEIVIKAYDTQEDSLGFLGYIPEEEEIGAFVNGQEQEYALSIGTHKHTHFFAGQLMISILILLLGMIGVIYNLMRDALPEKMFLCIAIPVGIAFLCLQMANIAHDVDVHFAKSYHYANVFLGVGKNDQDGMISMRQDDLDLLYNVEYIKDARNAQMNYHIWNNWSWMVKDDTLIEGVEWRWANTGNILGYMPGIIGIILARFLHLGTYPMFYLARICYFIFYLIGVYWAIKIVPVGKHLMVFIALLPMALQQAVNITYDNTSYVITFLYIALVVKVYFEGIKKREKLWIIILCCGLGISKGGIYTPLMFLLFFLPEEYFETKRKKWIYLLGTGILVASITLMGYGNAISSHVQPVKVSGEVTNVISGEVTNNISVEVANNISGIDKYGIGYAVHSTKQFFGLIVRTLAEEGGLYISSMLGSNPAWSIQQMPVWSYGLAGILLLLVKNGISEENYVIDRKFKIGLVTSFCLVFVAHLVLFLSETPRYYDYIWGIQGRYFLACSFFLLLGLRNNNVIQKKNSDKALYLSCYMQLFLYIIAFFELFMIQFYT